MSSSTPISPKDSACCIITYYPSLTQVRGIFASLCLWGFRLVLRSKGNEWWYYFRRAWQTPPERQRCSWYGSWSIFHRSYDIWKPDMWSLGSFCISWLDASRSWACPQPLRKMAWHDGSQPWTLCRIRRQTSIEIIYHPRRWSCSILQWRWAWTCTYPWKSSLTHLPCRAG